MKVHDLKPAPGSSRPKRRVGRGIAGEAPELAGVRGDLADLLVAGRPARRGPDERHLERDPVAGGVVDQRVVGGPVVLEDLRALAPLRVAEDPGPADVHADAGDAERLGALERLLPAVPELVDEDPVVLEGDLHAVRGRSGGGQRQGGGQRDEEDEQ